MRTIPNALVGMFTASEVGWNVGTHHYYWALANAVLVAINIALMVKVARRAA